MSYPCISPTFIGIDPGRHGCIVAISPSTDTHPAIHKGGCDHPTIHVCRFSKHSRYEVIDWLRAFISYNAYVAIEKVTSSPQMGVRSAFTFGQSFGWLEGLLQALSFPHQYVRPQTWQKDLQIPPRKEKTQPEHKRVLADFARSLYPDEKMTADVADALLIAHWCRLQHKGEER